MINKYLNTNNNLNKKSYFPHQREILRHFNTILVFFNVSKWSEK